MKDSVKALFDAGDWRLAAELAESSGDLRAAEELYEKLMDSAAAGRVAVASDQPIRALEHFLRGGHFEEAERVRAALISNLSPLISVAVETHARARAFQPAAVLALSVGHLERAAELFIEGHEYGQAALLYERLGRWRAAGELYDQQLRLTTPPAAAILGMARVMQRLDQHSEVCSLLAATLVSDEALDRFIYSALQLGLPQTAQQVSSLCRGHDEDFSRFLARFDAEYGAQTSGFGARYEITGVDAGPFPEAYLALDSMTGEEVLIQLLRGTLSSRQQYVSDLYELSEPPQPGVLPMREHDPRWRYVVFDSPKAKTLSEALASGASVPTLNVARQIAKILHMVHLRGGVHGSLSPWSVYLRPGCVVVVAGFALLELASREETATFSGGDTPLAYLAPEAALGGALTPSTDAYGLAAVLHRLVVGEPPPSPSAIARRQGADSLRDKSVSNTDATWRGLLAPEPASRLGVLEVSETIAGLLPLRTVSEPGTETRTVGSRYTSTGERLGAAERLHDSLLGREVWRIDIAPPLTIEEKERLRAFANHGEGGLQNILELGRGGEFALLESLSPSDSIDEFRALPESVRLAEVVSLASTVAALHQRHQCLGVRSDMLHIDCARRRLTLRVMEVIRQGADERLTGYERDRNLLREVWQRMGGADVDWSHDLMEVTKELRETAAVDDGRARLQSRMFAHSDHSETLTRRRRASSARAVSAGPDVDK
ncbi:MAG: hypothetical protein CO108_01955 [Deltaproteobacteria bacterium CG_4_9_14_3_um_filter_63_12]|nr:MAG: hypothetical protein CO108_01955 [Deltaproteobacteria bacterium CG_4_9_14_3_um_filter_63_12]